MTDAQIRNAVGLAIAELDRAMAPVLSASMVADRVVRSQPEAEAERDRVRQIAATRLHAMYGKTRALRRQRPNG